MFIIWLYCTMGLKGNKPVVAIGDRSGYSADLSKRIKCIALPLTILFSGG